MRKSSIYNELLPVEKKKAYDDIVEQVRILIEKGDLKQGDRLPSERDLTDTFKVSRTTVREAFRILESMKLIETCQGRGTYVITESKETLIQILAEALFQEDEDIRDIFHIRKIIEPHIAYVAANNASSQEIEELKRILIEHRLRIEQGESVLKPDFSFHCHLAVATQNRVMARLFLAMEHHLSRSRTMYLTEDQHSKRDKASFEGHQKVFTAIVNRDCRVAMELMLQHLEDVERIVFPQQPPFNLTPLFYGNGT